MLECITMAYRKAKIESMSDLGFFVWPSTFDLGIRTRAAVAPGLAGNATEAFGLVGMVGVFGFKGVGTDLEVVCFWVGGVWSFEIFVDFGDLLFGVGLPSGLGGVPSFSTGWRGHMTITCKDDKPERPRARPWVDLRAFEPIDASYQASLSVSWFCPRVMHFVLSRLRSHGHVQLSVSRWLLLISDLPQYAFGRETTTCLQTTRVEVWEITEIEGYLNPLGRQALFQFIGRRGFQFSDPLIHLDVLPELMSCWFTRIPSAPVLPWEYWVPPGRILDRVPVALWGWHSSLELPGVSCSIGQ